LAHRGAHAPKRTAMEVDKPGSQLGGTMIVPDAGSGQGFCTHLSGHVKTFLVNLGGMGGLSARTVTRTVTGSVTRRASDITIRVESVTRGQATLAIATNATKRHCIE
jgi:hypothetical protein